MTTILSEPVLLAMPAKTVFFKLVDGQASAPERDEATRFLCEQLTTASNLESDLPDEIDGLYAWMEDGVADVGRRYREYLDARQSGDPRQYFQSRAHALYFLKAAAPTKLVDGAWLYGLLPRWQDARFTALIQTYLEELGEGLPSKNHVTLYKKLLASQGIERWDGLSDAHYVQGAIQLALAHNAEQFLPEVIGFNMGYEQLPLHLLICAYELKELGIDPYYFTLHITVDNADSGHARKAVDAIKETMPTLGDPDEWWRRVRNGYKLNLLGAGTNSIIDEFDLGAEMVAIFSRKGSVGQYAHSDYRRVAGRTVNEWLSEPALTADFLQAMEQEGWFKRHQDPENSRFWKMIQSEKAKMFGVFSAYEQQVIFDWITGNAQGDFSRSRPQLSHDTKRRLRETQETPDTQSDFEAEVRALETDLSRAQNPAEEMNKLIALLSPSLHHTVPGLLATRLFCEVLG